MILGLFQVIILFLVANMYGFESKGSILVALIIAIPATLFVVGVGLLIGSFFDKSEPAQNIGTIFTIILGFLSGSFLVFPELVLSNNFFGTTLSFTDLIPSAYASDALKQVLIYNMGFEDIIMQIVILLSASIVIFIIGIIVYQNRQLKRLY